MGVIRKVFRTLKKYLLLSEQNELRKQKTRFYSILPQKDPSKKKLELTIKSLSQRQLKGRYTLEINKPANIQIDFNLMDKRQTSCLFQASRNKKEKKNSEVFISNHSESFLETKRKPLAPRLIIND